METNSSEMFPSGRPDRDDLGPEDVRPCVRDYAEEIEQRELQRAIGRLEARGSISNDERRIVESMATAIVDGVLAAPEAALEDVSKRDLDVGGTVFAVFDLERSGSGNPAPSRSTDVH